MKLILVTLGPAWAEELPGDDGMRNVTSFSVAGGVVRETTHRPCHGIVEVALF